MTAAPEPFAALMREHRRIEAAVAAARRKLSPLQTISSDADTIAGVVKQLWAFQLLLEHDVERHIAKEERVLFPVVLRELHDLSAPVDEMVAEHGRIKAQRECMLQVLLSLGGDHDTVRGAAGAIRSGVADLRAGVGGARSLAALQALVEQLDWLFQGHFTGEEDGIFLPAEELLSAVVLQELAREMAAFDTAPADRASS
jgi:hemerythrin-like domain-containing protein